METEEKPETLSDWATASNPGRLKITWWWYALNYPRWPLVFLFLLVVSVIPPVGRLTHGLLFVPVACGMGTAMWHGAKRVKEHFWFGCTNPGVVLATKPLLIAVSTDLTSGGPDLYPVIKVMQHVSPVGRRFEVGERLATVALYWGYEEATHHIDFDPRLVDCVSRDAAEKERVFRSIPAEEWTALEDGLRQLPRVPAPGLYPVGEHPRPN